MPSASHDYSDSEGDSPPPAPASTVSESTSVNVAGPSKSNSTVKSENHHPLRITLRPSLNHLINSSTSAPVPLSDRSSLSPPPPITLKFGMKHATSAKASYSSSSSDEEDIDGDMDVDVDVEADVDAASGHPQGKKSKSETMPAQHRKTYDWLQPGTAAASHHGPPPRLSGWTPEGGETATTPSTTVTSGVKKSSKKRPGDAPAGPGKAWRKGLKKGMAIPWKEGGTFQADGSIGYATPAGSYPLSQEGTPEPPPITEPPVPFVPADPALLDFPVYRKPIIAPKVILGNFPKVTAFFFQDNGGDSGPFPRKERVRDWKLQERVMVGVGGGQLKVKTWHMGPPSELGRLLQAEKEAKDLAKARKSITSQAERPSMPSAQPSYEGERPEDDASEIGDGEESNAGSVLASTQSSKPPKTKSTKPKQPRKSKLAQEIVALEPEPEAEVQVEVDPEPEPEADIEMEVEAEGTPGVIEV
ncbi:hypothetical protein BCR39DRAFT_542835 [Naematelia encephala]|uniref:Uncharacterized protein n=1 Tax=Naematelia encephala TaxID=71784 RepID=A0A1Y2ATD3_9TREE|nr:hypothetical protein BCR39DRAFT_542835 [Naematelia encephala]